MSKIENSAAGVEDLEGIGKLYNCEEYLNEFKADLEESIGGYAACGLGESETSKETIEYTKRELIWLERQARRLRGNLEKSSLGDFLIGRSRSPGGVGKQKAGGGFLLIIRSMWGSGIDIISDSEEQKGRTPWRKKENS